MDKNERRKQIIDLLKKEDLTSKELAERINTPIKYVSPIISELMKQGEIYTFSPRRFRWGIRKESGIKSFVIFEREWVELVVLGLKIWFKGVSSDRIPYDEENYCLNNYSLFEIYENQNLLNSHIRLAWNENEIRKEMTYTLESNIFKLTLIYSAISDKSMQIRVKYEKHELKPETKEDIEKINEAKKQISKWMEENFK